MVSIIIVNWNAGAALSACLASLAADAAEGGSARQVILVDNGSSDGSTAVARDRYREVEVLQTGSNLGFAAGANHGAEAARGDVVVFLNPDACVRTGAIRTLVDALLLTPGAGIAGGGLVDAHGRWEPAAARFGPLRHLLLDTTVGRLPARRRRAPYRVDWVYGTFVAVRRDLFRHLGGFDARYFMYGEDLDLCYRAAGQGMRTIHVPQARAMHAGSVSARVRFGAEREAEVVKGEMRFYAARRSARELRLFRLAASCKFGLKTALAAARGRRTTATIYGRVLRACLAFDPSFETE
ncbi:MAG: glycosyltransferase family 2 protein [Deltaproteobacteria bacterium]|nr:MAG: glycosyltransferase family 2 protein [Deltaproteobacteria bacterium]